jgi:ABC-type transport system substrate-binding protein
LTSPAAATVRWPGARVRDPARDRADVKRLLPEAGFGPGKPLRLEMSTRSWALQTDLAVFVQDQLRHVGIETTLKQMESAVWYPAPAGATTPSRPTSPRWA